MQNTTPNLSSAASPAPASRSAPALKSFTDLSGALIEKEIDLFAEQIRKGIDNWRTAGKILVELSKRQPDIFKLIQMRHPNISETTLQTFARIGRNEIWPPLLVDSSIGARRLLECNYDTQKRYAEEPIEVAVSWNGSQIKSVKRKVSELTRAECAIVFSLHGGIHNLEQQVFRLRNPKPADIKPITAEPKPVRLVNVDVGYFMLRLKAGNLTAEAMTKNAVAQPIRLIDDGKCLKAAVVFYKQEYR